jgi:hypothetical protein
MTRMGLDGIITTVNNKILLFIVFGFVFLGNFMFDIWREGLNHKEVSREGS